MAIIQCPNCGEAVSDKAKRCVHCNYELIPDDKRFCPECDAELDGTEKVCPKCGCPIETTGADSKPDTPQQVEVTGVKVTNKSKKKIAIIIAVVIIAMIAVIGIQNILKKNTQKKYASNLELATTTMLLGASEAEDCGNLIKQVWFNAIYEERNSKTDAYTCPNGYFVSDFNDALGNLFSDSSFRSQLESIENNQTFVRSLMKDLKNPPEEYEDAYEALSDLYDAYLKLTNLATDPKGSLQTFSSNFNDADTETYNAYSAMKLYID